MEAEPVANLGPLALFPEVGLGPDPAEGAARAAEARPGRGRAQQWLTLKPGCQRGEALDPSPRTPANLQAPGERGSGPGCSGTGGLVSGIRGHPVRRPLSVLTDVAAQSLTQSLVHVHRVF